MEKADKVTIRLTPEQASAIDFLVEQGEFKNRSEAIRSSIDKLIAGPDEKEEDAVKLKLPDTMLTAVDLLVSMEHFVSRELGLRELIRNGLERVDIKEIVARRELLAEMGNDLDAKDILDLQYRNMLKQ
jgi:metal-responsive CopG/Arc/MetJ family transcriptional regulator